MCRLVCVIKEVFFFLHWCLKLRLNKEGRSPLIVMHLILALSVHTNFLSNFMSTCTQWYEVESSQYKRPEQTEVSLLCYVTSTLNSYIASNLIMPPNRANSKPLQKRRLVPGMHSAPSGRLWNPKDFFDIGMCPSDGQQCWCSTLFL